MAKDNNGRLKDMEKEVASTLESAVSQLYQFAEHTLPGALRMSTWCEANVKDAFVQARNCEYCVAEIPRDILERQLEECKIIIPASQCGFDLNVDVFAKASQKLYLNFLQNPEIRPEILECINRSVEDVFGSERLLLIQQRAEKSQETFEKLSAFIKYECHPNAAVEAEARIICERLRSLSDKYSIGSKIQEMLNGGYRYNKMIFYMLNDHRCSFPDVILENLAKRMKNDYGSWNWDRASSLILGANKEDVINACDSEMRQTESKSGLLKLVYEFLNDATQFAHVRTESNSGGSSSNWDFGVPEIGYRDVQEICNKIAQRSHLLNFIRILMEDCPPHNKKLWNQLIPF